MRMRKRMKVRKERRETSRVPHPARISSPPNTGPAHKQVFVKRRWVVEVIAGGVTLGWHLLVELVLGVVTRASIF